MSRSPRAAKAAQSRLTVVIEDARWRKVAGVLRLIRRGSCLALKSAAGKENAAVTILLSDDCRLKSLNRAFRGKNKPTNVLSFAADSPDYLGDVAIAYETAGKQARAQRKTMAAHAAHLAVHGILHLLGYDHECAHDAKVMEDLEIRLLARLKVADPYCVRPLTRGAKAA